MALQVPFEEAVVFSVTHASEDVMHVSGFTFPLLALDLSA
jgi:hypothetical protein